MLKFYIVAVMAVFLTACGYVSDYEKGVYGYESLYCYQSIGAVQCFKAPRFRDQRRMVNYFGPSPARYDQPEPPAKARLDAPPTIDFYVRDPEPIPEPAAPKRRGKPLPWLSAKVGTGPADGLAPAPDAKKSAATAAPRPAPEPQEESDDDELEEYGELN